MDYRINPAAYSSAFPVPGEVVDRHLKLCSEIQIKVLLFALKHLNDGISADPIAAALNITPADAEDALLFWAQAGIFDTDHPAVAVTPGEPEKEIVSKVAKPTRTDVARRGAEDRQVRFLLGEAQQRFGRNLKTNEATTLLWLYDDQGMDVSVILLALQLAVSEGRPNISFVERTAISWIKNGVHTVADAERQIADSARQKTAWGAVESIFGLERHKPSPNELTLADQWLNEWKMPPALLQRAYNICVDAKSAFSMKYVKSILENWHAKGYTTEEQIEQDTKKTEKSNNSNYAAYDLAAYERMLNSDD